MTPVPATPVWKQLRRRAGAWILRAAFVGLGLGTAAGAAAAALDAGDVPAERAWVLVQPDMAGDLYLEGQLTDSRGHRCPEPLPEHDGRFGLRIVRR